MNSKLITPREVNLTDHLSKVKQKHQGPLPLGKECRKVGFKTYLKCFDVFWSRVLRFVLVRDKVKSYEF